MLSTFGEVAEALLSGLAAGAQHSGDLRPGMSVFTGRRDSAGQFVLAAGDSANGITDPAQSARVSIRKVDRRWIQRIKPLLGSFGGLLELLAGSGHIHYLSDVQVIAKLGAKRHRVDSNEFAAVIKYNYLKKAAASLGTDVEIAVPLAHNADCIAHGVFDICVGNAVFAGVIRNFHLQQVTLPTGLWQVILTAPG